MVKHIIYIGIGSNLSSAEEMLALARRYLMELSEDEALFSTPITTEPIDFPWPAPFLNQVARITTTRAVDDVKVSLKRIERQAGRRRGDKQRGIVCLDLDLLAVDGVVFRPADWQRSYIRQGVEELEQQGR